MKNQVAAVFSDGGLTGKYGSEGLVGVYCWVHVDYDNLYIEHKAGIVYPYDGMAIEINTVELCALLRGLSALPDNWTGRVYSDNKNALAWRFREFEQGGRVVKGNRAFAGVPPTVYEYMKSSELRYGPIYATLLDGHPTPEELAVGIGHRGNPVNEWNAFCDSHCNAMKLFYAIVKLGMTPEQADARFRMKPADYARLRPDIKQSLAELGYPLAKKNRAEKKKGSLPRAVKEPVTA